MALRALDSYGMYDKARVLAKNHHSAVVKVFEDTGTFWENYAPDYIARGESGMTDFVGWSGLPPIAVFLEYIIGIRPHGKDHMIEWRVGETARHGVENYPVGRDSVVDLVCEARANTNERPRITAKTVSGEPIKIKVIWSGGEYELISE